MKKFRKIFAVLIFMFLALCGSIAGTEVSAVTSGDFEYMVMYGNQVSIIKYLGDEEDVVIPSEIDGMKVTTLRGGTAHKEYYVEVHGIFEDSPNVKSVTIPDTVTRIEDSAFIKSSGLASIKIPVSVTYIGYGAFAFCDSLTEIEVDENNENYSSVDGVLMKEIRLWQYPTGRHGNYVVPDSVKVIENRSFSGCKGMTSINIHSDISVIDENAFVGCENLTDVYYAGSERQWKEMKSNITYREVNLFGDDTVIHYQLPDDNTNTITVILVISSIVCVGAVTAVLILSKKKNKKNE